MIYIVPDVNVTNSNEIQCIQYIAMQAQQHVHLLELSLNML